MPPPTITYNDFSKLKNKIEMLEKEINMLKEKEIYDLGKKIAESLKDNDEYWGEKFNNLYDTIEKTRSSVTFLFDLIEEKLHPGEIENFTVHLENLEPIEPRPDEPIEPVDDESVSSEVSSLEGGVKKRRKSRKNKKKLNIRSRKKRRR